MWPFRRRPPVQLSMRAQLDLLTVHAVTTVHAVIDDIAEAFAADPVRMTLLLSGHANAVFALDAAVIDPHAADHELSIAAAEVIGTRSAVLSLSPAAADLTDHTRTTLETDR